MFYFKQLIVRRSLITDCSTISIAFNRSSHWPIVMTHIQRWSKRTIMTTFINKFDTEIIQISLKSRFCLIYNRKFVSLVSCFGCKSSRITVYSKVKVILRNVSTSEIRLILYGIILRLFKRKAEVKRGNNRENSVHFKLDSLEENTK